MDWTITPLTDPQNGGAGGNGSGGGGGRHVDQERQELHSAIKSICDSNKDHPLNHEDTTTWETWQQMDTDLLRTVVILLDDNMRYLLQARSTRSAKKCHLLKSLYEPVMRHGNGAKHPSTGKNISDRQRNQIIQAYNQTMSGSRD